MVVRATARYTCGQGVDEERVWGNFHRKGSDAPCLSCCSKTRYRANRRASDDYLAKPVRFETLREKPRAWIGRAEEVRCAP